MTTEETQDKPSEAEAERRGARHRPFRSGTPWCQAPTVPGEPGSTASANLDEAASSRAVAGPWLGVDLGEVRVGLAKSDPDLILATPLATWRRAGDSLAALAARLAELAQAEGARQVVVGYPLNMDGSAGPKAREAASLAERLRALGVATALQDERRSTVEAAGQLRAAGRSTRAQRDVIDQAAAVLILQAALDAARLPPAGVISGDGDLARQVDRELDGLGR
ncbi:MAG: Holliday junction resolvase RuvX [Bifidobacteriaceae bacterium]|nr:Holliday junction resolvase RuvX [Bifidobacteriaceae bacterium]